METCVPLAERIVLVFGALGGLPHRLKCWCGRGLAARPTPTAPRSLTARASRPAGAGGPRGYDAGKKIKGRKQHTIVDTLGQPLVRRSHPADVQDRDGGCRS